VSRSTTAVTIPNGASLSAGVGEPVQLGNASLVGIIMPAAWTAASLTFQGSNDGTNFFNIFDVNGAEYVASAAASRYIPVDPVDFSGVNYLKLRSGTSGTPVNQGADRIITLVFRTV
jgi:hypothetical protein